MASSCASRCPTCRPPRAEAARSTNQTENNTWWSVCLPLPGYRECSVAETSSARPRASSALRAYDQVVEQLASATRRVTRVAGAGAGTSLPGLVVQRLDPGLGRRRAALLTDGVTVVSGTNGKTTTAAMIAAILAARGTSVVANSSGANLFRGVAGSLAAMRADDRAGVFEVDEGALG